MGADASPVGRDDAWWPLWAAAIVGVVIVLAVHRESPRTLLSAHGLLHGAIAARVADGGPLPPENPFYAGEPLGYYWFYQSLGAVVMKSTGLDPIRALEAVNCIALAALVAASGALARALYGAASRGVLIAFLVVAGANPQAPALLGVAVLRNGTGVLEERPEYLWGLVHVMSSHMRWDDPIGMYGPLWNFFLNITARPAALSAVVVTLLALQRVLTSCTLLRLALLCASVALCSALSVLVGVASAGALGGALVLSRIAARTPLRTFVRSGVDDRTVALAACAMGIGIALAAPTFAHLFAVGSEGAEALPYSFWGTLRVGLKVVAASWLTLGLGMLAVVRTGPGARRDFVFVAVVAAIGLIGSPALVALPVGNEDNLFHAGLVILAVTAPAALADPAGRISRRVAWGLGAVFVPTFLLVLYCYHARPDVPIVFSGNTLNRPAGDDRDALYRFIRTSTEPDAVFAIDTDPHASTMAGNTAELPALTGRTLLTERVGHYIVSSYPDVAQRVRISDALVSGSRLEPADIARLGSLGRPIYVVSEGDAIAGATRRYGPPEFEQGAVALFRWRVPAIGR